MEFTEIGVVNNAERRLLFTQICWLNKKKFVDCLQQSSSTQIEPCLNLNNKNKIFIGKSIPDTEDNIYNIEEIGSVVKCQSSDDWVLNVPHGNSVVQIKTDFLVLKIESSSTYSWIKTSGNNIPKYALRCSLDTITNDFFYVGRTIKANDSESKPSYFNRLGWSDFENEIPECFGKVHVGHGCLYVPFNKLELKLFDYEILCLKPSPNKLRILTRDLVRQRTNYSNSKIDLINKNINGYVYVPNVLIETFIKYSTCLLPSEYILKNEKITRDDQKFELVILDNTNLVIRSIDEKLKFERLICRSVESIWLHNNQVVIYHKNVYNEEKAIVYRSVLNDITQYKLMINEHMTKPNLVFRSKGKEIKADINFFEKDELEKYYDSNYYYGSQQALNSD